MTSVLPTDAVPSDMSTTTLSAIVHGLRYEAASIISVELRPTEPGARFPAYEAGAHIDLHLPNGLVRSYSLINPLETPDRYVVAVLKDHDSRGGSRFIHDQLRVGQRLQISAPRNHFRLDERAPRSFLLAGGIGVTPLYAMLQRLAQIDRNADMLLCVRSRAEAAFVPELMALAGPGRRVRLHADNEAGGPPDLAAVLSAASADTHFYCCGPLPMIRAFEQTCERLGHTHVHVERFSAEVPAATPAGAAQAYTVELRKSCRQLVASTDRPLLDTLLDAGIDAPHSCREGICGACETAILEGEVDHRDSILSAAERSANRTMMICVSHARSSRLVLDL